MPKRLRARAWISGWNAGMLIGGLLVIVWPDGTSGLGAGLGTASPRYQDKQWRVIAFIQRFCVHVLTSGVFCGYPSLFWPQVSGSLLVTYTTGHWPIAHMHNNTTHDCYIFSTFLF